ncbi:MAG: hypothetical protein JOZ31_21655 [Verrucomicrobia bacterium]|nr:hypothetical protein [Verrucomicrobiota bacterium]MBV8483134.1 hypothetical protein [Verrucomicrobiota bacterium]
MVLLPTSLLDELDREFPWFGSTSDANILVRLESKITVEPQKKYPAVLEKERKQELAKIQSEIDFLKLKLENLNSRYAVLQRQNATGQLSQNDKIAMQGCWEDGGRFTAQINELEKRKQRITQQRKDVVERDAEILFKQALEVGAKSGKNKLYIGSRQFVAQHADSKATEGKKANARRRLLNANNWTWGVNFAWVEGGTTAAARIKIKENEENPNPFETIPQSAYDQMMIHPRMGAEEWLELCRQHPNTILWHGRENRPTWTALEIEACLNAGYMFAFREHKHRAGRVIELVPRG